MHGQYDGGGLQGPQQQAQVGFQRGHVPQHTRCHVREAELLLIKEGVGGPGAEPRQAGGEMRACLQPRGKSICALSSLLMHQLFVRIYS
jgi:hypothetical protein